MLLLLLLLVVVVLVLLLVLLFVDVCCCLLLFVVVCCSFRTLVRAHRKRRSTAGHGGFYVIFASVRRVSRHHGVGWGSDDVPLDLLMLRHALGWGGAVMTFLWTWSRCWCYATHWGGVVWGGAVMTFLWTWSRCWCYATHWGGVGWDSAACFSLLQKRKDESNRVRTEKNRRLEPGQRLAEGVTQKRNKRQMLY